MARRSCSTPRTAGSVYPRAFLAASRLDLAALRRSEDCFVDELIGPVWCARAIPSMRAHFPALLCRRQPRALRARSAHVRGPPAVLRQYPLDAGGRRPRHGRARGRRRPGNLPPALSVDDALRRIEGLYKPYHRALRRLFTTVHRAFGTAILIDCHSMPSTAGVQGRAAARRCRARRPLRHQLRGWWPMTSSDPARPRLLGQPQQALCRRLHHRALRQPGRRAARHPARAQPRALHGRAAVRAHARIRPAGRRPADAGGAPGALPIEELRPYRAAAEYAFARLHPARRAGIAGRTMFRRTIAASDGALMIETAALPAPR